MFTKKELKILLPILTVLGIFVYFADPTNGPIIPCMFNKLTGLYCPGCGMTRAVHYIMRFRFYEALKFNPLIVIIPPLLSLYYLMNYGGYKKIAKIIIVLLLVIVIGFGIIRNLHKGTPRGVSFDIMKIQTI